jgi:K+-sensing histidine kinase KdpD
MNRPDPDELLDRIQRDEEKSQRGRLKVFFGASAGVGKTFAMLQAARRRKEDGVDVVMGIVETHGRKETLALIDGLEVIAPARIEYRGRLLAEFDLDAALARKPQLILVDELAHSNVQGCRHLKRWQDVYELLAEQGGAASGRPQAQELAEAIHDEALRMTGLVTNLLDMARLQEGSQRYVRVNVTDSGPGLPAGMESRVFDKFTRGEKESATPGIGLGLAICRAIVEAHGGRIGASNRTDPNGQVLGATFWFLLPADENPPIESELMEPGAAPEPVQSANAINTTPDRA